ncbi:hypothetical protein BDR05DRAFT_666305 [Suillus weaverae]|nr:hypothetical protein BDR05DRAFT_666305 [Suillus weaverae]
MFRDEATLVHGEKVHSILEDIGIEDDETMFAVLTMDDERLNDMLQEAKRLNLVEKYSVIQAMRNFGRNHKIVEWFMWYVRYTDTRIESFTRYDHPMPTLMSISNYTDENESTLTMMQEPKNKRKYTGFIIESFIQKFGVSVAKAISQIQATRLTVSACMVCKYSSPSQRASIAGYCFHMQRCTYLHIVHHRRNEDSDWS